MRILILGGDGMLGHRLLRELGDDHEVTATLRRDMEDYASFGLFHAGNSIDRVDARDLPKLVEVFAAVRPDLVVNAVGIVKQRDASRDVVQSLELNALLPHRLARLCQGAGARLVHVSTDCVFAGDRGGYAEDDVPDALDLYGQTKRLGEVSEPGCLTLRTSIVGLELHRRRSLVEWFLAQSGPVPGYTGALFTGVTTAELSRVVRMVAERFPGLHGVYQVASEPISKYDLLSRLTALLGRTDVRVEADAGVRVDRTLRGDRFAEATGYRPPPWDDMLRELAAEVAERQGTR
jgi:dTDP-4-dehydrorhamnose reductase